MSTLYQIDETLNLLLDARADMQEELAGLSCLPMVSEKDMYRISELEELSKSADADIQVYVSKSLAKVDGIAAVLQQLWTYRDIRKAESQRLAALSKQSEDDYNRLEGYILALMGERGYKRLEGNRYKLTAAGNGGMAPLEVRQPELVPMDLQSIMVRVDADVVEDMGEQFLGHVELVGVAEPNRRKIRERLESGEAVPGCILGERGQHLRIK